MFTVKNFLVDYTRASGETLDRMDAVRDAYSEFCQRLEELNLPVNAEYTTGFRKLVEAKDCHVRALIQVEREKEGEGGYGH